MFGYFKGKVNVVIIKIFTVPYFQRVLSMARCVFEIWSEGSCRVLLLRSTVEIEMKVAAGGGTL